MYMVGRGANCNKFMAISLDYFGNVLFKFILPNFLNKRLAILDRKNEVKVCLHVCVCHFLLRIGTKYNLKDYTLNSAVLCTFAVLSLKLLL